MNIDLVWLALVVAALMVGWLLGFNFGRDYGARAERRRFDEGTLRVWCRDQLMLCITLGHLRAFQQRFRRYKPGDIDWFGSIDLDSP